MGVRRRDTEVMATGKHYLMTSQILEFWYHDYHQLLYKGSEADTLSDILSLHVCHTLQVTAAVFTLVCTAALQSPMAILELAAS